MDQVRVEFWAKTYRPGSRFDMSGPAQGTYFGQCKPLQEDILNLSIDDEFYYYCDKCNKKTVKHSLVIVVEKSKKCMANFYLLNIFIKYSI